MNAASNPKCGLCGGVMFNFIKHECDFKSVPAKSGFHVDKVSQDVTIPYALAEEAAKLFNPGIQVNIAKLMRSAYVHGYAQALIDVKNRAASQTDGNHV